jgi:hypothetical protein
MKLYRCLRQIEWSKGRLPPQKPVDGEEKPGDPRGEPKDPRIFDARWAVLGS